VNTQESLLVAIAKDRGLTRYDLSCGSHIPDVYPCKYCQKVYRKIDGHWHAFCAGCGVEFNCPAEDRAHRCQARKKLIRAVTITMMPWPDPKRLPRKRKKAIKKANGGVLPGSNV
jgi:hypothetical protein